MAIKKKLGDRKKVFRFAPGLTAPIVDRDGNDFEPFGFKSIGTPTKEKDMLEKELRPGKEYRVIKGYYNGELLKYQLQEKTK